MTPPPHRQNSHQMCLLSCMCSMEGTCQQASLFGAFLILRCLLGMTLLSARIELIATPLLTAFAPCPPDTQVLEVEPWDAARHGRYTGRAWRQCGDRVPGYLTDCRTPPQTLVQQNVVRMARQLYSPRSKAARKWSPEVVQRVEALAAKLDADPRYQGLVPRPTDKQGRAQEPGLSQQQEREREDPRGAVVVSV